MAEEREEGRWAHLLQPIRELSANWDVDIAADLGDYLSALERIEFTFDGGHTSLNFAEGARLSDDLNLNFYLCKQFDS